MAQLATALNFDSISVISGDREGFNFSPAEFIQLPVSDRVRMVLGKQIAFSWKGEEVDKRSSLNELRKWTAEQGM